MAKRGRRVGQKSSPVVVRDSDEDDSEDSDSEFGQKLPPLSKAIRDILKRYPDGQVFKELIQNADDARARTIHFYIDYRKHPKNKLLHRKLERFQGPSLIAYNDAIFSENDWKSIQKIQDSNKAGNPFKVGQFGIGFNSVYHITDLPIIVSGKKIGIFDPQSNIWRDTGKSKKLSDIQQCCRDQLLPFDGIGGFNSRTTNYKSTLFRFPLRTQESELSTQLFTVDKLKDLIDSLRDEAKYLLLFLKHLESIEVYTINSRNGHSLLYKVEIAPEDQLQLRENRRHLLDEVDKIYKAGKSYGISETIDTISIFSINLTVQRNKSSTKWIVSNLVGSNNDSVKEIAEKVQSFPVAGAALEISSTTSFLGRLFCFLPLPPEVCTDLPVHINGTFSLNDDRRGLKWPSWERRNDFAAEWNVLLVDHVISCCYGNLLLKALETLRNNHELFYQAIPDSEKIKGTKWKGLLVGLYSYLFQNSACFFTMSKMWVTLEDATFLPVPHLYPPPKIVLRYMQRKHYNLVRLPPKLWKALEYAKLILSLKTLSPNLTRKVLKRDINKIHSRFTRVEKQDLLYYCLLDKAYSDLCEIQLLPLADGSFDSFKKDGRHVYVCTEKCSLELLPCGHEYLVSIPEGDNPELQTALQKVAHSQETQLRLLQPHSVARILSKKCFDKNMSSSMEVSFDKLNFPEDWLKTFWKWLVNQDNLILFENIHIVPVTSKLKLKIRKLSDSGIIIVDGRKPSKKFNAIVKALNKFNVACVPQWHVPYIQHDLIFNYLYPLTSEGILKAVHEVNSVLPSLESISISEEEAACLQSYLTEVPNSLIHILQHLPIFMTVKENEEPVPVCSGIIVLEPLRFLIPAECLPSNFIMLSRSMNEELVIKACPNIKLPKSSGELLMKYIFPLIREGEFSPFQQICPLMEEVLKIYPSLENKVGINQFSLCISKLSFLPVKESSSELKRPEELFDPLDKDLKDLYAGESVFPMFPFNQTMYLTHLRRCGLRQKVNAQDIYQILLKISKPKEICRVSSQVLLKAKKVFGFIKHKIELLEENVSINRNSICLQDAIYSLVHENCILPIESQRPSDYPRALPWKGSSTTSHLTTMNDSVLPLNTNEKKTMSNIVGSRLYIVYCPSSLCSKLRTSPPVGEVIAHFKKIIECKQDIGPEKMTNLAIQTYSYLESNYEALKRLSYDSLSFLRKEEWVWIKRLHKFVASNLVAFSQHSNFSKDLFPYIHVVPTEFLPFKKLMTTYGAHETITDDLLVSVLHKIKERADPNDELQLKLVTHILEWVTNSGTEHAKKKVDIDTLLVPIMNPKSILQLENVKEVVYTDTHFLKVFLKNDKSLKFIHKGVEHLSKYLGVVRLSEKLNISGDVFEDVGQSEPLVTRLRNILRDYNDGLTIVKELLQNADDAEATEVNICYDTRKHTQDSDELLFPGMSRAHGPALIVHNNKTFSDDDFRNIQKLAGATKRDQPLKIGKFGVGFCSVYHITDVPSFVSRDSLYIFDPKMEYLKDQISDPLKPGKKICFTNNTVVSSEQMNPYRELFEFQKNQSFNGTIFRLPLRKVAGEISEKCYRRKDIEKLIEDIAEAGPKLLLFLSHLKSITFQKIDDKKREVVLRLNKKIITSFFPEAEIVTVEMTKESDSKQSYWLISKSKEGKYVSSIACFLKKLGQKYIPEKLCGEAFCFLPLHLRTGLPVHVSANFAVMNDRKNIHYSDSPDKSNEAQFNEDLMSHSISRSYFSLLLALKSMWDEKLLKEYEYFMFWPVQQVLLTRNLWIKCLEPLYRLISTECLCYSRYQKEWLTTENSKLLSSNILRGNSKDEIKEVLELIKPPVIDLPMKYHSCCRFYIMSEFDFLNEFFEVVKKIQVSTRNKILFSLIQTYGMNRCPQLKSIIKSRCCVPCTPVGKHLRKCDDIVDPQSKVLGPLFEPKDGYFPIDTFLDFQVHASLIQLGMHESTLPLSMVINRAKTVEIIYHEGNERKALERAKSLLKCIEDNASKYHNDSGKLNELQNVPFLPVMQIPSNYPKVFCWAGRSQALVCSSQILREVNGCKAEKLVGSQNLIISQEDPENGGCGRISDLLAGVLQVKSTPRIEDVVLNLIHVSSKYSVRTKGTNERRTREYTESLCLEIYKFIDEYLSESEVDETIIEKFHREPLLWTGDNFVNTKDVAFSWKGNGPYLYKMPSLIKYRPELLKRLKISEHFETEHLLDVLLKIKSTFNNSPISEDSKIIVKLIAETIVDDEEGSIQGSCYLYDKDLCMQHVKDLAYNDAPWCTLKTECNFVHSDFSREVVKKVGIKFIRSKVLDQYDDSSSLFGGDPFGQFEKLTQRIKNILDSYVYNETILKELLQNADDAKATKLYFILDERTHGREMLPSSDWEDLQGPALLVWNDQGFTEEDIEGIQKLGLGSKRSKAESIGQYGVGFNVVYHLTDCPSLFTNGSTLCIFDPHCRYVPGATALSPGRRLDNVDSEFWENYTDLRSAYLQNKIKKCPREVQTNGSLFRFPLRYSQDLVNKSQLVDDEISPLTTHDVKLQLEQWLPRLKESLLFLKHVKELVYGVISKKGEFITQCKYKAELDSTGISNRSQLHEKAELFRTNGGKTPFITHYPLKLIEEVPIKSTETWLIQQGIGDTQNSSQHWEYLSHIYPMHGLAAQIQGQQFTPKIFCFLPLPLLSNLPVHVNANFILDSSSRSSLWTSRDTNSADDKKKWNDSLIEALSSSYAQFLVTCQNHFLGTGSSLTYDEEYFSCFYNLFPKWLDSSSAPEVLLEKSQAIHQSSGFIWEQGQNANSSSQIYFWKHSRRFNSLNIREILKSIGMKITVAPFWVKEHFDKLSIFIPEATPDTVFSYYSIHSQQVSSTGKFPCYIKDSSFMSISSFKCFVKYLTKSKDPEFSFLTFSPKSPSGVPLLLTKDEYIREFDGRSILTKYHSLFPKMNRHFVHPEILDLHLDPAYFLQPDDCNELLILEILDSSLPSLLKVAQVVSYELIASQISLKVLWECLSNENVFSKHLMTIISKWALILSNNEELYSYTSTHEHLMPIAKPPRIFRESCAVASEYRHRVQNQNDVFDVLVKLGMPYADDIVINPHTFCPSLDNPKTVLRNLYYFYNSHPSVSISDESTQLLFTYFKSIDFCNDHDSLKFVKALPLFKTINGNYCNIAGKVYMWPMGILMDGIMTALKDTTTIFLASEGMWRLLATPSTLSIQEIHCLTFYTDYVFPKFETLSDLERYAQLTHIKDELYLLAEMYSDRKGADQHVGKKFLEGLQKLPVFEQDNVVLPINYFSDPYNNLFQLYPHIFFFPPLEFHSEGWLSFLKSLGLQLYPSKEQFVQFCKSISNGKNESQTSLVKLSETLLNCLFETTDWHEDENFLREVSCIHFVIPDELTKLSWILKPCSSGVHYIQDRESQISLVRLKDTATLENAALIWTVSTVVSLPKMPLISASDKKKVLDQLAICSKPSGEQVINNLINISKSPFSNFKLFEKYHYNCVKKRDNSSFFDVVTKNLKHIHKESESNTSCLIDIPCIPVSSSYGGGLDKPVLVRPLQVISTSSALQPELHPFLHVLPEGLYPLLSLLRNMKVNSELKSENIIQALSCIHSEVKMPIDFTTSDTVKLLLKTLYSQTSTNSSLDKNSILYLPDCNYVLMCSKNLVYDDKGYYKNIKYQFDNCKEYSALSLLCSSNLQEREEYGFDLKSFVSKIPSSHAPTALSNSSMTQLSAKCKEQEDSKFVRMIKNALKLTNFAGILGTMLKHKSGSRSIDWDKFISFLDDCFASLEVVTIDKLIVDITFTLTSTAIKIAEASMDFLLDIKDKSFTLYLDSGANAMRYNMLESLSEYFISSIIEKGGFSKLSDNSERCLASLLKAENSDDVKQILMDMGINSNNIEIDRGIDYNLKPKLGERIPVEWHHRLHADLLNNFRPQELIGYEEIDDVFIFARVEYKLNQVARLECGEDEEMDMYVICTSEDNDDEHKKTVLVINIYKILSMKDIDEDNECLEIERHDSQSDSVKMWEFIKDKTLKDIYDAIYKELLRNSRISDPDLRRKCLKAMYLKWHPDKNNSPHATEAFRYLERQIDRIKRGLNIENPDAFNSEETDTFPHSNDWVQEWIILLRQRRESLRREQTHRKQRRNTGARSEELGETFEILVSPDIAKARIWFEQAKYDLKVMKTVHEESVTDATMSAHVCFLAHQVAEKSLKAGMYAKNGLHPNALKYHDLISHACALEQVATAHAIGLSASAQLLQTQDCYLKTRYPNRFGAEHKVPSLEYTQEQATKACQAGKKIFEIVRQIISIY